MPGRMKKPSQPDPPTLPLSRSQISGTVDAPASSFFLPSTYVCHHVHKDISIEHHAKDVVFEFSPSTVPRKQPKSPRWRDAFLTLLLFLSKAIVPSCQFYVYHAHGVCHSSFPHSLLCIDSFHESRIDTSSGKTCGKISECFKGTCPGAGSYRRIQCTPGLCF